MGGPSPQVIELLSTLVLLIVLCWITITDLREYRIPDAASLPLIALGLMLAIAPDGVSMIDALLGAGGGYLSFAMLGAWFYRRTGQDGLGLGDAKLLAAAGAWLGWQDLPTLVAMAAVGALIYAICAGKRRLAFGPWLAAAFWIMWLRQIGG